VFDFLSALGWRGCSVVGLLVVLAVGSLAHSLGYDVGGWVESAPAAVASQFRSPGVVNGPEDLTDEQLGQQLRESEKFARANPGEAGRMWRESFGVLQQERRRRLGL
jgi:hypothetical protein